jgi:HPt (histidine-containing phosphotransfer) domain-containing protein
MDGQATEPALDHQLALLRVGGDSELLREIAVIFLADYPRSLAEIRAAIAAADGKQLETSAHALKGSVANFGARAAVESASRLEQMGHAGDLRQSADALHALEQALSLLHAELEAL